MPFDQQEFEVEFLSPQKAKDLPIGHQRLLVLAEFLETNVPAEHFNMRLFDKGDIARQECGSAACALGWAGIIPAFVAAGYRCRGLPTFMGFEAYRAVEAFFDMPRFTAADVFGVHHSGKSPAEIADGIRSFVAELGA